MGGIVNVTPFERMEELERGYGLETGSLPRGPFGQRDDDYAELDAGRIDEGEYWRRAWRRLPAGHAAIDIHDAFDWTREHTRPEVVTAMERIHAAHRLVLLTNDASHWMGPGWQDRWELRGLVDAVVDSAEEGVRKPAPEIYLRAAAVAGVPVAHCLFVDDLHGNVDGALRVGMRALWFDVSAPAASTAAMLAAAAGLPEFAVP